MLRDALARSAHETLKSKVAKRRASRRKSRPHDLAACISSSRRLRNRRSLSLAVNSMARA